MTRHKLSRVKVSAVQVTYSSIAACLLLLQSSADAFLETPKFSQLRLLYPGYRHHGGKYTNDDVMQLVLGFSSNTSTPLVDRGSLHGGAAAVRLSWTLNRYGGRHAIGRDPVQLIGRGKDSFVGADGQQYIYRSEAFGPFLAARYGDPVVERLTAWGDADTTKRQRRRRWRRPSLAALAGRQGIMRAVRYVGGRREGHVGLWNCGRFYESRDWTLDTQLITVEFWEAADSYCPPVVRSGVSVEPRMQTLESSVHIVARHNFASPTYLNDESRIRRQTSNARRNPDRVWLQ